jgi:soluble lytic murein transglycosylase
MHYQKNSLLLPFIVLILLFSINNVYSNKHEFIFPKKKLDTINSPKENLTEKKSELIKTTKIEEKSNNDFNFNIPPKKPSLNKTITLQNIEPVKSKEISENKEIKNVETNTQNKVVEVVKSENTFLLPIKKPLSFIPSNSKIASKSEILDEKDFSNAKEIFNLIKKGKWNNAISLTEKVKNKEFKNLVTWLYLLESGNQATFNDYQNFISRNSDYPRIGRLKYLAEHKIIIKNSSPRVIINWFNENEPLSGTGKIKLGEAYLELGNTELAENYIKDGWINADLSSNDLKYYKNKFNKFLTTKDHLSRADYLAWDNQYWDLKRMLVYLPKKERALYNARFILMTNSYGVDKAISDVPEDLINDLGLEYNRLAWRTRRNRLEGSLEILRKFHGEETLVYPEKWWNLRENITRDLIYEKKYSDAYEVASNHHLQSGADYADAEWISGWLSVSFLNKPDVAIKHFENFYNNVSYPISSSRGAYWLAYAYEKAGNKDKSTFYYKAAAKFTNTYYGQLAFIKINAGDEFKLNEEFKVKENYEKEFNKNKLINLVKLLFELDKTEFSKDIIKHLATLNVENGSEVLAAKLATDVGRYDYAIQIAKDASYEKRYIHTYNYPTINIPEIINNKVMPPPHLVHAIIRQESEFDARANSYVGAQGLMQIMPNTAKIVAKSLNTTYSKSLLTNDPDYNIKLGTYYFNGLLEDYDGVFPYAIGAYNAGPNRIKSWIKRYGDPNRGEINFVDWIELIRFRETRNYVQRVMENINVYKIVLNNSPNNLDSFFRK